MEEHTVKEVNLQLIQIVTSSYESLVAYMVNNMLLQETYFTI